MSPSVLDLIEFRAFSSIWYWLLLGLIWTRVIHAPLGVPFDLLRRADRRDHQAARDVELLGELELRHRREMALALGPWGVAVWAFGLTVLALLGLLYQIEPAQAVLLIAAPMAVVQVFTNRTRRRIEAGGLAGPDLRRALRGLRSRVQGLGLVSVFVTALWGMYTTLAMQGF